MSRKKITSAIVATLCLTGCGSVQASGDFTAEETALIQRAASGHEGFVPEGTMRVLTVSDSTDYAVLRSTSSDLSARALISDEYEALARMMVATVTHPSQDGVGIAGPQVGLNRRVVAVQRFDKEGEPFEVYPNISIVWASDSLAVGPEGCLSVPDRREDVARSTEIVIEYDSISPGDGKGREVRTVRDTVSGFTAVIFQHETDHLDGILYIDRL